MKVDILGVKVDDVNMEAALAAVEKWVWNPGKYYIVTPNPEFLVAAQTDSVFKKILNDADLSIPDGIGLRLSGQIKNTFSGTDFMEKLVKLAAEKGFTTGFLGSREGVAKSCAECLKKKYPGLKVTFSRSGGLINDQGENVILRRLAEGSQDFKFRDSSLVVQNDKSIPPTDLLFVAFGHIKQEKWIANNLDQIPVKLAMGVGGAFDYLSGAVPRAPLRMRNFGLEWLFRLIIQPWRIKRQMVLLQYLWLLMKE